MLSNFIKHFKLSKKKAALAFIFFALLITLCCGKRKPPLPPIEKTPERAEISGIQRGNKVTLSWEMQRQNLSKKKAFNIERIDIYRLIEPLTSSLSLSEEEFSSRSTLIATLPVSDDDLGFRRMSYTDTLEFAGQVARLRYAIRFVNSSGQKASFSNFLLIEPTATVANAPTNLNIEVLRDSIKLNWKSPISNVDGSRPPNILGYNILRSSGSDEYQLLNQTPILAEEYVDKNFDFGKRYKYHVRSVSIGNQGEPLESLDSETIEIFAKDIFPPNAPEAVTVAAAPNNLSLFFTFNAERDIAGYRIYRSQNLTQSKSEWLLLTTDLLKTNTYQDTNVESGKTYFYYITAVDNSENESEPSEVVSETVP